MQVDDFIAKNVVAGCDSAGDDGGPGKVVVHKFLARPFAIETSLVDSDPFQSRLICRSAVTVARSNVGKYRTNIVRPIGPEETNFAACSY